MNIKRFERNARRASTLLASLSNERRLLILCQLVADERSVGELAQMLPLSQSALSQHLARLRRDGLVRTRRQRQTIFYSLAGDEARRVIETLYGLYCGIPTGRRQNTSPSASCLKPERNPQ
jgi:DNA-binding transcriptional ArsR family regulator